MSNRKVSVESLIDEMYDALERATKLPLMSKSLVNVSELTSILDEINENLPQEITQARSIVSDRNNIIEDAKREAEGIIILLIRYFGEDGAPPTRKRRPLWKRPRTRSAR